MFLKGTGYFTEEYRYLVLLSKILYLIGGKSHTCIVYFQVQFIFSYYKIALWEKRLERTSEDDMWRGVGY
jgi:hypothetical protein